MSKPIINTAYTLGKGPLSDLYPLPVVATRAPLSTDINFPIGQIWINRTSGSQSVAILTSVIANVANWTASGTSSGTFVGGITVGTSETFSNLSAGAMFTSVGGVVGSAPLANGQLLIGQGVGNPPTAATLTGGTGISISNAAGSITINATGPGGTWTSKAAGFAAAADNGYVITAGSGSVTATLPTNAALGDEITIIYPSGTLGDILIVSTTGARIRIPGNATAYTTLTWPACNLPGSANPAITLVCTTASATVPVWTALDLNVSPTGS